MSLSMKLPILSSPLRHAPPYEAAHHTSTISPFGMPLCNHAANACHLCTAMHAAMHATLAECTS